MMFLPDDDDVHYYIKQFSLSLSIPWRLRLEGETAENIPEGETAENIPSCCFPHLCQVEFITTPPKDRGEAAASTSKPR